MKPSPELLRRMCAPVLPIADLDELLEVAAVVLEGDGAAEDLERLLEAWGVM